MKKYQLGNIGRMQITADNTAIIGAILLYGVLVGLGVVLFDLSVGTALGLGLIATFLHLLASYLHHLGHSLVARRTGHPMTGAHFHTILARSVYPRDEGDLPAQVHIQRALGGPLFSVLIGIICLPLIVLLGDSVVRYLIMFFAADNFFTYAIGALTPLGFTDGSTILYWRNKN